MLCFVIVEEHSRIQELTLQEKVQQLLQAANLEDLDLQSRGSNDCLVVYPTQLGLQIVYLTDLNLLSQQAQKVLHKKQHFLRHALPAYPC